VRQFGDGGNDWIPLVGDWDGAGADNPILYDQGGAMFHRRRWTDLNFPFLSE
jgi:hypothetical protein